MEKGKSSISIFEFIALMAMMMSLPALSIDAMLPALTEVGSDLGVAQGNDNQLIISTLFLGLSIGQLIYGPLSDSIGRKPSVYTGMVIFVLGSVCSILTNSFEIMLLGRVLQGLGLSGPRIVCVAIIRDQFKGERMAQIMSFVMTVFIIVPTLAPIFGQAILQVADWRAIFVTILAMGMINLIWFTIRQEETLKSQFRIPMRLSKFQYAFKEVLFHKASLLYTIAGGFVSSAFIGFLNSSQQVFQFQYELGESFPMYFAISALCVGGATFLNGKLVVKYGMYAMVKWASIALAVTAGLYSIWLLSFDVAPTLMQYMAFLMAALFSIGILFGNLNSLAMEPLGHVAGVGAAVVGSLSSLIAVPFGTLIGIAYDGTVVPIVLGFAVFGMLTLVAILWSRKYRISN